MNAVSLKKTFRQNPTYWYCRWCQTIYVNDIYWFGACHCPKDNWQMEFIGSDKDAEKFLEKHAGK